MKVLWVIAAVALLATAACSQETRMGMEVWWTGTSFETEKITNEPSAIRARAIYSESSEPQLEQIKAQAILNGVRSLQKEGYDRVEWSGPYPAALATMQKDLTFGTTSNIRVYRGVDYVVRGWRPGEASPSSARPIPAVLAELGAQAKP